MDHRIYYLSVRQKKSEPTCCTRYQHSTPTTRQHDSSSFILKKPHRNSDRNSATLDSVVYKEIPILFLNTEMQGDELPVLKGAQQLFDSGQRKMMAVDFSYGLLKAAGTNPLTFLHHLAARHCVCTHSPWLPYQN